MIELKVVLFTISKYTHLNNMGWIRIRMDPDPELGKLRAGSGTRKIQSWIRIRNKSFRIQNTADNEWNYKNPFSWHRYLRTVRVLIQEYL